MGFGCGGGSTCKAALKKFEESTGSRAAECPEIRLIGVSCILEYPLGKLTYTKTLLKPGGGQTCG